MVLQLMNCKWSFSTKDRQIHKVVQYFLKRKIIIEGIKPWWPALFSSRHVVHIPQWKYYDHSIWYDISVCIDPKCYNVINLILKKTRREKLHLSLENCLWNHIIQTTRYPLRTILKQSVNRHPYIGKQKSDF